MQKTACGLRVGGWLSDVCTADLRMVAVRRGFVRHRLLPCSRRRLYRDLIILRSSLHAQHQDTRDGPAPEGHFGTAVPRSLAPSARHTQQEDRVPARLCAIAPDRLSAAA